MKLKLSLILLLFLGNVYAQSDRNQLKASQAPFFHGVASGDPQAHRVMIWTKLTPPNGIITEATVYWQIATDLNFTNIVGFGKVKATEANDFTVKVDVCGLDPNAYYYYVFRAFETNSIIGRTKTAPLSGSTESRFGVVSCSSYEHGYFNAYENLSKRNDLDAVIHLGDYIYEYETGGFSTSTITNQGRTYNPTHEIISLDDYRIRHSHYKLDNQLQRLHQVHPFITTWDDHETANDSYKDGAENHSPSTEGSWINRKISGTQAYKEYMPLRNPDPTNDLKIWRKLRFGNLLDLIVVDSRLWGRDEQNFANSNDINHHLLGDDQFAWLEAQLLDTTTQWKIICNQVMMAPLELFGLPISNDQWDGYNAQRNRLLQFLENNNIENTVVLTGDIHSTWINNVPGINTNTAAVEFVVTSVTSPGLDIIETALGQLPQWLLDLFGGVAENVVMSQNSHMEHVNTEDKGYMVFTVNNTKAQGDYFYVNIDQIDSSQQVGPTYYKNYGAYNLQQASAPIAPNFGPPLPPKNPIQNIPFAMLEDTISITLTENTFHSDCFISVGNVCPSLNTTIIDSANFGSTSVNQFCYSYQGNSNYNGLDYVVFQYCDSSMSCDTVVMSFNILSNANSDTMYYSIASDSILQDCIPFTDLYTQQETITSSSFSIGLFDIDTTTACFTYTPDSTFNGTHFITLVACDSVGVCDTSVLIIQVLNFTETQTVELFTTSGGLFNHCWSFDDVQAPFSTANYVYNGINDAMPYNDTCFSYISQEDFEGVDTILFYACNSDQPPLCDTILFLIHVEMEIDSSDTVSVRDIQSDFSVIGVYPNPFNTEILIQYVPFTQHEMFMRLTDAIGKVHLNESMGLQNNGLKYARINTQSLERGTYFLEIYSENKSYVKKLIKY